MFLTDDFNLEERISGFYYGYCINPTPHSYLTCPLLSEDEGGITDIEEQPSAVKKKKMHSPGHISR